MDRVLLGHGSGGKLMHGLISQYLSPAFRLGELGDSAILESPHSRLAYTTDSYVISPIFFPGGDIGSLAVNGTVNDLAVAGARPLYLTAGFIIEEGFQFDHLEQIIRSMKVAADRAGVKIVAGDTKVVEKGKGDGIFINTSGIGVVKNGLNISPRNIKQGDIVLISGPIGNHGAAIIARRNGISFKPELKSDSAPLNGLTELMLSVSENIRFMRDPTRGGLATTLKEAALDSSKCIRVKEAEIPVLPQVKGACDLLGLDPLYAANEGILIAVLPSSDAEAVLSAIKTHPLGRAAKAIGVVEERPQKLVLLETALGGTRLIDMLEGEQLPRIC